MDLSNLAARVVAVRAVLDVSAREASRLVGLSPTVWSRLESGTRDDPRVSTIEQIAERTTIAAGWLITGKGALFPERPTLDLGRTGDHAAIAAHLREQLAKRGAPELPSPTPKRARKTTAPQPVARTKRSVATPKRVVKGRDRAADEALPRTGT